MEKLAIHGGTPASERLLGYGRQSIDEDDVAAVVDVLGSDFLTCGPATERFEGIIGETVGASYVTAVANGTAALHVACLAAGIGPGARSSCPRLRSPLRLTACFTAVAPLCSLT